MSVLAPGLHPLPFLDSGCFQGPLETEVSKEGGRVCEGLLWIVFISFFQVIKLGKGQKNQQQTPEQPTPCERLGCESFCLCMCLLCSAWCVGPNSCCKVAAANREAPLFLVADAQVSPSQLLSGPSLVSGLPARGA